MKRESSVFFTVTQLGLWTAAVAIEVLTGFHPEKLAGGIPFVVVALLLVLIFVRYWATGRRIQ